MVATYCLIGKLLNLRRDGISDSLTPEKQEEEGDIIHWKQLCLMIPNVRESLNIIMDWR